MSPRILTGWFGGLLACGMQLHFGLGTHRRIDRLEVRWLGGNTDALADLAADQIVALKEGDSPPPPRSQPSS